MTGAAIARWVACLLAVMAMAAHAAESDPAVPPGKDPGGVAVALIGSGVDYTRTEIARRIARDGEGEIIGWNFVDNDRKPLAAKMDPAISAVVSRAFGTLKIIPIKATADKLQLGRSGVYVGQSPARIAFISVRSANEIDWVFFKRAAQHFADVLFIVPAGLSQDCDSGTNTNLDVAPIFPAWLNIENMLVVSTADPSGGRACAEHWSYGRERVDVALAPPTLDMARYVTEFDGAVTMTGIAAHMLIDEPGLPARDLKDKILKLAKPFPPGVEPYARSGWMPIYVPTPPP